LDRSEFETRLGDSFRRVLIAEDNSVLCRSLVRLTSSWGAKTLAATTVAEALEHLAKPVDLVIADVRLPDGNAFTIFEHVVRSAPGTIMVGMSGRASAAEAFALARLGVHAFIPKPFARQHVEATLIEVLRARQSARSSERTTGERILPPLSEELCRFSAAYGLSDQQTELLRLLALGVPRADIPAALGITDNTCKTVVRRLLARCGAKRVADVIRAVSADASRPIRNKAAKSSS
jgi:DNA-binding NarL/FixJ family response regulator